MTPHRDHLRALLSPGDQFPAPTPALPGGCIRQLPDALADDYGVVLLYRGSWCPHRNARGEPAVRRAGGPDALG